MIHTWFTADFHLGHQNIIRYCNRPFHSTGEMDEAILANLNSLVRQDDVLYFLGDFCMGGPEQARRYRNRIVCRHIHVVELKSLPVPGSSLRFTIRIKSPTSHPRLKRAAADSPGKSQSVTIS